MNIKRHQVYVITYVVFVFNGIYLYIYICVCLSYHLVVYPQHMVYRCLKPICTRENHVRWGQTMV